MINNAFFCGMTNSEHIYYCLTQTLKCIHHKNCRGLHFSNNSALEAGQSHPTKVLFFNHSFGNNNNYDFFNYNNMAPVHLSSTLGFYKHVMTADSTPQCHAGFHTEAFLFLKQMTRNVMVEE